MYYGGCCSQLAGGGASVKPPDYQKHIDTLTKQIWDAKQAPFVDETLLSTYGNQLTRATMKGFGIDPNKFDWNAKDSATIAKMLNNVWQFSGAKTYQQLQDMGKALVNPDGSYRSFNDFKTYAQQIGKTQLNWLKAEYQNAIGGAQMVALWEKIQAEKDVFSLLQFDAVLDGGTTALCKGLDGVIRPVDDPFWQIYFPLNHWGCRSTVRQLRRGNITPTTEIEENKPNIPEMFRTNLGETGLIFPEDHPYFVGAPSEIYQANRHRFSYHAQFDIVEESEDLKGLVRRHYLLTGKENDFDDAIQIALKKAKQGHLVDILPTLNPRDKNVSIKQREIIFFDVKNETSADFRIDGKLWELEKVHTDTNRAVKGAIESGQEQANNLIIILPTERDKQTLDKLVRIKIIDYPHLENIEFVLDQETVATYRIKKSETR